MEIFLHKKDMPYNCQLCNFRDIKDNFCYALGDLTQDDWDDKRYAKCPLKSVKESELKPKYMIGDKVYRIDYLKNSLPVVVCEIDDIHIGLTVVSYNVKDKGRRFKENELYSTELEAQKAVNKWIGRQ